MSTITLQHDYLQGLRDAKPTYMPQHSKPAPPGSLAEERIVPSLVIPPVNTITNFKSTLPQFALSDHPELARMAEQRPLPKVFDWRHSFPTDTPSIKHKKKFIAKPGNQGLCGSCWAISAAGITGDNFVVSGKVNWVPNLSTTYTLACYPQHQCQGGNPAEAFKAFADQGIASNNCIDYSWCLKNALCNGDAKQHFKEDAIPDLDASIPSCGCYFDSQHYLYKIDKSPKTVAIGSPGVTDKNIATIVKTHIYNRGPVMGGFAVFKNFMHGCFTHINGGVYLENGVYDNQPKGCTTKLTFSDNETNSNNFVGSHAVAIIGWGIAYQIRTDNTDKRYDVPYWYCRNSWTQKWGDGGYFKMAMYPWNKASQFDKVVRIKSKGRMMQAGGMVLIRVSNPPVLTSLPVTQTQGGEKIHSDDYYKRPTDKTDDPTNKGKNGGENGGGDGGGDGGKGGTGGEKGGKGGKGKKKGMKLLYILLIIFIPVGIILIGGIVTFLLWKYKKAPFARRHGSYK